MQAPLRPIGFPVALRWIVWAVYAAAWTAALLTPEPDVLARAWFLPANASPEVYERFNEGTYYFSKALHVSAYASFAMLSGWLGVKPYRRMALLVFLSAHGFGTEFLQSFVPSRHPALSDVGLDHIGLMLGVLLTWRWWFGRP